MDDTLQQLPNFLSFGQIDLDKPIIKFLELEEYRTELQDDTINFMGLSEPKKFNYVNFAQTERDIIVPGQ